MFCHHINLQLSTPFKANGVVHTLYIMSKCPELYLSIFIDSLLLTNNVNIDTNDLQKNRLSII